uniref:Xaa-Pro aminopeptidase 2 n=1 Tax=Cairina moschata TaxID=8855 RepID=A0A8C3GD95_CAIMO
MQPSLWIAAWLLLLQACPPGRSQQAASPRTDIRDCSVDPPYLPPTATNTTARLAALRDAMRAHSVHAYIVPSTDAHMSEYIAERDSRLGWLTGFTGSAGTVVVTLDRAALWTDSRYWTQAERQLDCNWELQRTTWIKSIGQWILEWVPAGGNVSLDPFLFSIDTWNSYSQALQGSGRALVPLETNLVDQVWGDQRPPPASSEIYSLPAEFTGSSWQEKVSGIRQQMEEHTRSPTALLLSGLEETAWLFNLRGDDIPYNPVFYSYTLLTSTNISLFVDEGRLTAEARQSLRAGCPGPLCVELHNYSQARAHLQRYAQGNVTVWLGTEYTTYGLYGVIPQEKLLEDSYSPVMLAKAVKNSKEQELLRAAHVRDAVAVIQYLLWLEQTVPQGQVDEFLGARHIDALRWTQQHSRGPSFESISASGLNAALAHYSPSNTTRRKLSVDEMYLADTGGQYLDGTTDITRTVHWGTPTPLQKEAYTRVLMGNIDLSRLVFPPNTAGRNVEAFARRALWDVGLNYGHGTGHGIGNFLSVHEWPVGFQSNNVPLAAGMFTSIEPGYYRDGEFGIRIEDIALVVEAQTKHPTGEEPFLTFEVVSLVPYDRNLIDVSLLSQEQIKYLNAYYETIRARVGPELQRQQLEEEYRWPAPPPPPPPGWARWPSARSSPCCWRGCRPDPDSSPAEAASPHHRSLPRFAFFFIIIIILAIKQCQHRRGGEAPVCPSHLGPAAPLQRGDDLRAQGTSQPNIPRRRMKGNGEGARQMGRGPSSSAWWGHRAHQQHQWQAPGREAGTLPGALGRADASRRSSFLLAQRASPELRRCEHHSCDCWLPVCFPASVPAPRYVPRQALGPAPRSAPGGAPAPCCAASPPTPATRSRATGSSPSSAPAASRTLPRPKSAPQWRARRSSTWMRISPRTSPAAQPPRRRRGAAG